MMGSFDIPTLVKRGAEEQGLIDVLVKMSSSNTSQMIQVTGVYAGETIIVRAPTMPGVKGSIKAAKRDIDGKARREAVPNLG